MHGPGALKAFELVRGAPGIRTPCQLGEPVIGDLPRPDWHGGSRTSAIARGNAEPEISARKASGSKGHASVPEADK